MDIYDHQRLLSDPNTFQVRDNAQYIEAWSFEDPCLNSCERGTILDDKIAEWWDRMPVTLSNSKLASGLKILCMLKHNITPGDWDGTPHAAWVGRDGQFLLPLNMQRPTYEHISKAIQLPTCYLSALEHRCPTYELFPSGSDDQGSSLGTGYLIQNNIAAWFHWSLFIRRIANITYVLLAGGDKQSLEMLFQHLQNCLQLIHYPLLLPILKLQIKADFAWRLLDKCHSHILAFEPTIGYHFADERNRKGTIMQPEVLDQQIRRLTNTTGRIAMCKWSAEVDGQIADHLELDLHQSQLQHQTEYSALSRQVNRLKNFAQQQKLRAEYLEARRNGHIQTLYNLIAQKDNAENIRLADASVRLTEISISSNEAMKSLATDTKMIAVETLRDSGAMRTIAAVTMFFLPATFTATLFSTTFFDFQGNHGSVVSKWVWLYWLSTAILTACTSAVWWWSIRRKESEIKQKHDTARELRETKTKAT